MIDILMATYNGEKYLEEQLESIINQSYTDWRLIVRDDGSTDGTMVILNKYADQYPEKIVVKRNPVGTGSAKANFFKLLNDVQNEYVMFCDQDDIWNQDKVKLTYAKMRQIELENGKCVPVLVATDLKVVDSIGSEIDDSFFHYMNLSNKVKLNYLLVQNNITGCTVMINTSLCDLLQKVRTIDKVLMHDHFAALVACAFGKAEILNRSTIQYRQHANNSVGAMDAKSLRYMFARLKRGKKQFQLDMLDSMQQAGYLFRLYKPLFAKDCLEKQIIWEYSQLINKNKVEKCRFFLKYHVLKHGNIRKIMQLVWC